MAAVGMAMLWASYALVLYGYTRIKSMDVGFMQLVTPGKYNMCTWASDIEDGAINKQNKSCS